MTFNPIIFIPILIIGIANIIFGNYWKNKPPKTINYYYGFRTKSSMKSQKTWDFAQKVGARNMINYSYYLLLVSLLNFIIKIDYIILSVSIVVLSILTWAFLLIYNTEMAIRKKFGR
ncbi:SdpI family protein [Aequorivita sp. H23M31]|uniref:SdpI family protein n=1 Tax=Aequorivita ciconiae TaxID=2494375 RepID=A0A410FZX0_9FLAO|nr:SdpI family protein [Aequorivita sp. H23M31]QAA80568.1 SdpI family protein [Aequorivita sp. H23M31]